MKHFIKRLLFATTLLGAASLACTFNAGGPEPPGPPIPVSQEALQSLETVWQNAEVDPAAGVFAFTLTESQLTSAVAFAVQKQADPMIQDPQIYLQDGQIILFGNVERGTIAANARITIMPILDQNGRLSLQIASADFGPIPAPPEALDGISVILDELLTGSIAQVLASIQMEGLDSSMSTDPSDYFIFDTIQIANGMMTVAGRRR